METIYRPLLICNVLNINDRIYPKSVVEKAVENYNLLVEDGRGFGELGHPNNPITSNPFEQVMEHSGTIIPISNVSHKIQNLHFIEDTLWGDLELLDTPKGIEAKKMIDSLVARPRGIGTINKNNEVEEGYEIIAFDLVSAEDDLFKGFI